MSCIHVPLYNDVCHIRHVLSGNDSVSKKIIEGGFAFLAENSDLFKQNCAAYIVAKRQCDAFKMSEEKCFNRLAIVLRGVRGNNPGFKHMYLKKTVIFHIII